MKKYILALGIMLNASVALAQPQPYEESANNVSSQQLVVEALNITASHRLAIDRDAVHDADDHPAVAQTGIGPSSNMPQPGDYGYSAMSDLRQLNF